MRLFFLSILFLVLALPAFGQRSEEVVARWREGQMRAVRGVEAIRCTEESKRRVDSPYGAKEIDTFSRLRLVPGRMEIERDVERVEMNGRAVPERERQRVTRYLRHGRHERKGARDREQLINQLFWPARLTAQMQPEGPLRADPLAGGALRLDLRGGPDDSVERLTLWFATRGDRLVRSRLLARHRPEDPPLVVETEYRRRSGLDVPHTRHVEGSMTVRKRSRTYTMLYEQQIAYRDYRIQR